MRDSESKQAPEDEFPEKETMKGGGDEIKGSGGFKPFRPDTTHDQEMIDYANIIVEHERRSAEVDVKIG